MVRISWCIGRVAAFTYGSRCSTGDYLPARGISRPSWRYFLVMEWSAKSAGCIADNGVDISGWLTGVVPDNRVRTQLLLIL